MGVGNDPWVAEMIGRVTMREELMSHKEITLLPDDTLELVAVFHMGDELIKGVIQPLGMVV